MKRVLLAACVTTVLSGGPGFGQPGNPAFMTPGATQPSPGASPVHEPNTPDRVFAREAAIGGMAEVSLGNLAREKGEAPAVKSFGQRMAEDHTRANAQLSILARTDKIALPDTLDPEHQAINDRLGNLAGAAFDRAYIGAQITEHQKAIQLFEYEIGSGQDPELKKLASDSLPVLIQHLQIAQTTQAELPNQALQAAAPSPTPGSPPPTR